MESGIFERTSRREVLRRCVGLAGALGLRAGCGQAQGPASAIAGADLSETAPSLPVAIQRCVSYEPHVVRASLDGALDLIGGLDGLVRGKKVTVKVNMTGQTEPCCGLPPERTYQTHQSVLAALCAALGDAGARTVAVVESFYFVGPTEEELVRSGFDVAAIHSAAQRRVEFVNTRNRGTHRDYARLEVPGGGLLFPAYHVHRAYEDTEVFISLAKLKEHDEAGVTCAVKNLFGITPQALYGNDAPNENSVQARVRILHQASRVVPAGVPAQRAIALPAAERISTVRVPRIIADLLMARPVDLAIVDGIETITGGAGPWVPGVKHAQPGLLLAGRNAVCTDTVCSAVMGCDAAAAHGEFPFPGDNHLRLLAEAGVGTNEIARIEVCGLPAAEARRQFLQPPGQGDGK